MDMSAGLGERPREEGLAERAGDAWCVDASFMTQSKVVAQ
jgi:hypothetical protein